MGLRLSVFGRDGGSPVACRDRPRRFPGGWDVPAVGAAGRGLLSGRPAPGEAARLVAYLRRAPDAAERGRFALFGHGLGALVAGEPVRTLLAEGRTPPVRTGFRARATPRPGGGGTGRHLWSGAAPRPGRLRRKPAPRGARPAAVLAGALRCKLFAPAIRRQLRAVESRRTAARSAGPPALSVCGGTREAVAPPHRAAGRAGRAASFAGPRRFGGGRFSFRPGPTALRPGPTGLRPGPTGLRPGPPASALRIAGDVRRAVDLAGPGRAVAR